MTGPSCWPKLAVAAGALAVAVVRVVVPAARVRVRVALVQARAAVVPARVPAGRVLAAPRVAEPGLVARRAARGAVLRPEQVASGPVPGRARVVSVRVWVPASEPALAASVRARAPESARVVSE